MPTKDLAYKGIATGRELILDDDTDTGISPVKTIKRGNSDRGREVQV